MREVGKGIRGKPVGDSVYGEGFKSRLVSSEQSDEFESISIKTAMVRPRERSFQALETRHIEYL